MKKVLAMLLTLVVGMTWFTGCTPDSEHHAHTWSDWTETKAATCTEAGELYRECTGCGYKQTTYTAYGHKWGDWTTVTEQTCESKGEKKRVCSVCSAEEKQELPALGDHDYVMTVREGDCQTETIYTYTCSKCGDKYTETGNKVPTRHFGRRVRLRAALQPVRRGGRRKSRRDDVRNRKSLSVRRSESHRVRDPRRFQHELYGNRGRRRLSPGSLHRSERGYRDLRPGVL